MDCIFCKIIKGEIPSSTIYEDDKVKVFLDINPTTNGDTLVIPKQHFKDFRDINDELLNHMYQVMHNLYPLYQEKLHCDGLTICHNTDYGQEIKHFHIHFIPRYKDDNIKHIANKEILKDINEIENMLKNS